MPASTRRSLLHRVGRYVKRLLIVLFAAQLVYIVILKWVPPPTTLTMLQNRFSAWRDGQPFRYHWVSYDRISPYAKLAVMAGEDQLFPDHNGFDFKSIEKAWKHNQRSRHIRGASTISQQVARNVFLWQGRNWLRKGLEVYFTFMIEQIWGKKRILEMYLNVAQMGPHIFGVEAAAEAYFHKQASQLNREEAAMIAAVLPNPNIYRVVPPSRFTRWRQQYLLQQMRNLEGDADIEKLMFQK
ncbi:monofunctional biosynthetic peptidoglycan transglycosylase [Thermoflavifilum thermophilum]|uniref:Biosynthetic peptidoglycan transglycosylase n=1 Tax=Thermoflavifilum thermophilum TaxID=1393122 RepID=A0A1I7N2D2_9BACT|nr:monofunctional biosynthetic peptidoglycan transglycosylase [Thermoflavifilum thermophilum]SFV28820.1 monofunctional biosynthetic peptidoglycan transglycosylase [Thermoflavifilum thermophilum]